MLQRLGTTVGAEAGRPKRQLLTALIALLLLGCASATSSARPIDIRFEAGAVAVDAAGVTVTGRTVFITAAGSYRLSGRLDAGRLVVDTQGAVRLLFDGVGIYAATGPALMVVAAEAVEVELASGSFNTLFDGRERLPGEPGATLHSNAPLRLGGDGHLLVMARLKHGVESERELVVDGGVLTVSAADDGVRGAGLAVRGGDLTVFAVNDALKAAGQGPGLVEISGGSLDLVAGGDGVQADGDMLISGGVMTVAASDDGIHTDGAMTVAGGEIEIVASYEGLEAPWLNITGGTVLVNAVDDALNAAGDDDQRDLLVSIQGGYLVLNAGSDALDSNGSVRVTGGSVVLNGPTNVLKPAVDQDDDLHLDGGLIVAVGSLTLRRDTGIHPASTLAVIYVDFHWLVPTGEIVTVGSAAGDVVTFRLPKAAWTVSVASPLLEAGAEYHVHLGGAPVGEALPGGLFEPAGVVGGEMRHRVRAR